jgi:hypothetical protein
MAHQFNVVPPPFGMAGRKTMGGIDGSTVSSPPPLHLSVLE